MLILTVNAGSSSLKFNLIELPKKKEFISGLFERIGDENSFYSYKIDGKSTKKEKVLKNHSEAFEILIEELLENKIINSLEDIDGVGHRIVHGGDKFSNSVILTPEVIKEIVEFNSLAPLHNPVNIVGVKACLEKLPNIPMVGVFDTAFHQTIPLENFLYPVPYSWYENYKIRKYGFHGTSHKFITKTMQKILNKEKINIISCHIGSGGSITCIKDGKSFDTTMGFSPNSGIMMGTRCGDIDYSIIDYYQEKSGNPKEVINAMLNKESGLLGVSGTSSDHRDIEEAISLGKEKASLADKMYIDRIVAYIVKYYVALETKVDAIVFTAGLGENAREFRSNIVKKLNCLNISLNEEENMKIAGYLDKKEGLISDEKSNVPIYVVPTNEELMIAQDTYELIK